MNEKDRLKELVQLAQSTNQNGSLGRYLSNDQITRVRDTTVLSKTLNRPTPDQSTEQSRGHFTYGL